MSPPGAVAARCDLVSTVLSISVVVGETVREFSVIAILESMKMEIPVLADIVGTVSSVEVAAGDQLSAGDVVAWLTAGAGPTAGGVDRIRLANG